MLEKGFRYMLNFDIFKLAKFSCTKPLLFKVLLWQRSILYERTFESQFSILSPNINRNNQKSSAKIYFDSNYPDTNCSAWRPNFIKNKYCFRMYFTFRLHFELLGSLHSIKVLWRIILPKMIDALKKENKIAEHKNKRNLFSFLALQFCLFTINILFRRTAECFT